MEAVRLFSLRRTKFNIGSPSSWRQTEREAFGSRQAVMSASPRCP